MINSKLSTTPEELRNILRKLVNLAGHPYFPEVKDLPAWGEAIQEARNILSDGSASSGKGKP